MTATLEYGKAPPLRQRRWFRWVVALSALSVVVPAGWRYGGPLCRHAQVLWWQRTCMTYTRPADLLVYTDDPAEADKLSRDTYIQMYRTGPAYYRDLPAYQGLSSLVGYDAGSGGAIVYMHERTNSAGDRRLVVVYLIGEGPLGYLRTSVLIPASAVRGARWSATTSSVNAYRLMGPNGTPLRLFAGQSDPDDPALFTVAYRDGDARGVLRGKLVGDAVAIEFE